MRTGNDRQTKNLFCIFYSMCAYFCNDDDISKNIIHRRNDTHRRVFKMTQAEDFKQALEELNRYYESVDCDKEAHDVLDSLQAQLITALQRAINEPQFHDNDEGGE